MEDAVAYGKGGIFVFEGGGSVLGRVQLWGDVVEHEHGYRAEFAKVLSLDWSDYGDESLAAVRQRYGIVEPIDFDAYALARLAYYSGIVEDPIRWVGTFQRLPSRAALRNHVGYVRMLHSDLGGAGKTIDTGTAIRFWALAAMFGGLAGALWSFWAFW